jgi:expansin
VPRVVEPDKPSRHRSGGARRPAAVAAGLTAAVVVGAVVLVGLSRVGTGPEPVSESLDRATGPAAATAAPGPSPSPTPSSTASPTASPTASRTARRQAAPVAAGTLRAAPATSRAPSPTAASRERRGAPPAGATRSGTATFYTLDGLPNCGYPDAAASGTYVALSPADFAGSAACGTVFDVTGPKGTVRVTVADQCPECEPGHLDLAAPAFARIADPVAGIVPIRFTRVVDPPTPGPVRVRVKEGSSAYWLALLPIDTGNPLASVTVRGAALERTGYGYWVAPGGAGPGPYQVRLTDDRGHAVTVTVPLSVGATVSTGARLY